jgi:hypothetical protein
MNIEIQEIHLSLHQDFIVSGVIETTMGVAYQDFIQLEQAWYYYPSCILVSDEILNEQLTLAIEHVDKAKVKKNKKTSERKIKHPPTNDGGESVISEGKPIIFVVPSKETDVNKIPFYKSLPFLKKLYTSYDGFIKPLEVKLILDNSTGLSELYNTFLTPEFKNHIIVFVHDDVYMDDLAIASKLHEAHTQFNIVGVAGCISPLIKSPALWHLMADKSNLRGFCSHMLPNGKTNSAVFGLSNESVDLMDGVFMSVDVDSVLEVGCKFEEEFDFHFYDLAFCMNANKLNLKLGVWPIFIRHLGLGSPDGRWVELERKFISKYSTLS